MLNCSEAIMIKRELAFAKREPHQGLNEIRDAVKACPR